MARWPPIPTRALPPNPWTNEALKAGQSLTWRDHLNIGTPGNYQVYLGICFSGQGRLPDRRRALGFHSVAVSVDQTGTVCAAAAPQAAAQPMQPTMRRHDPSKPGHSRTNTSLLIGLWLGLTVIAGCACSPASFWPGPLCGHRRARGHRPAVVATEWPLPHATPLPGPSAADRCGERRAAVHLAARAGLGLRLWHPEPRLCRRKQLLAGRDHRQAELQLGQDAGALA